MSVTCQTDSVIRGVTLVVPSGRLDESGASELWEVVPSHITDATPSLLVDMTAVEFMTSAGIGVLIRVLNRTGTLGGRVALFGCNEKVQRVLSICELETAFNVCDSLNEARSRFDGKADGV